MLSANKNWDARVIEGETVARSDGFRFLRDRIVELAEPLSTDVVVDIGSGTGLLTLALAGHVAKVWAVDSAAAMNDYLRVKAASAELTNVALVTASAVSLPLVDDVADAVVSNYCFHELREPDKRRALAEVARILRPGGRLVISDMMFSLHPGQARDRRIVLGKLRSISRRGLPGIWRLLKNAVRLVTGRWESPASLGWWEAALSEAGFERIEIETFPHEGGIATARRPGGSGGEERTQRRDALGVGSEA